MGPMISDAPHNERFGSLASLSICRLREPVERGSAGPQKKWCFRPEDHDLMENEGDGY